MLSDGEGSQHVCREVLKVRSQPLESHLIRMRGCLQYRTCELCNLLVTLHALSCYVNVINMMTLILKQAPGILSNVER